MTSPRYPLPTDLMALVSHDGRVYPNEARTWDRLGTDDRGPHPLESALEQWFSFATGKHTWVSVRGATIRGLVSARRRAKRSAWEVDCLIDADEDKRVVLSLLERMAQGVIKQGAERVFLRLAAESRLVDLVRQAGFFAYAQETLYRWDRPPDAPAGPAQAPSLSLRPRLKSDTPGLYQLYCGVAPANVRAIEGVTLREWQAAQEPWGGHPTHLVLEEGGLIVAWLRFLRGQEGKFALLVHPEQRDVAAFMHVALVNLADSRTIFCLGPARHEPLPRLLLRLGFRPAGNYVALARRLAKPVQELAPEKMGTAVPVS